MTHEEEVKYVNDIIEYEKLVAEEYNNLQLINQEKYDPVPPPPIKRTAPRPAYPPVKSNLKYDWEKKVLIPGGIAIALFSAPIVLLSILPFIILTFAYIGSFAMGIYAIYGVCMYFTQFTKTKQADIERIRNSPEYKQQCDTLDQQFKEQQAKFDEQYDTQLAEYENNTLPAYNKALELWETSHNKRAFAALKKYHETTNHLTTLYDDSKLIPKQYRSIPILQYIADIINTSDYNVKAAIEIYDRHIQQQLEQARLYEQQVANQQAMIQNQLLDEQNYISDKARREANIASAVGIVQRHNTNKTLKNIEKHLK